MSMGGSINITEHDISRFKALSEDPSAVLLSSENRLLLNSTSSSTGLLLLDAKIPTMSHMTEKGKVDMEAKIITTRATE